MDIKELLPKDTEGRLRIIQVASILSSFVPDIK